MRTSETDPLGAYQHADVVADDMDTGSVLALRLNQLRRTDCMKQFLEAALTQLTSEAVQVDAYQIEYCKIKPRREINVVFDLKLRWGGAQESLSRRFSCTIWSAVPKGWRQFVEESDRLAKDSLAGRPELAGFSRFMAFVP